jgi:bacterioferritin
MGTKGREIVGHRRRPRARAAEPGYASEWLAYYQYWLGAKVIKGPMKDAVAAPELNLHATEELNHAVAARDRIIQLGGTPVLTPTGWGELSPVSTMPRRIPTWPCCSIRTSPASSAPHDLQGADGRHQGQRHGHHNLALTILEQEVEHEEDLQSLREDLDLMVQRGSR